MSIVGLVGPPGQGHIIAEGRFVQKGSTPYVDTAFIVDEQYQGLGVCTYLYRMLARIARGRGYHGMTADVLASNKAMLKVYEKGDDPVDGRLQDGIYELTIRFDRDRAR
jgi:ribosomal protein S18 acetylase RimI-like enzyme